jgi:hypothetical protein
MPDVVRQLVGIGMVPWPVIKLMGLQRTKKEMGSVWWVPCEHDASPCLGHAAVCSGCALTILLGSLGSASARQTFSQKCGSVASRSCSYGGSKTVLNACFLGVPAKTEVHRPPGFRNFLDAIAASHVYKCIQAVKPIIWSRTPL